MPRTARSSDTLLATRNDLPEAARSQIVGLLNRRLADAVDLTTQCKQAHWNVRGANFIAIHRLFDELHESVSEYADLIAERIGQLGGLARGTAREAAENSELDEYPVAMTAVEQHVKTLSGALAGFGSRMRFAIQEAGELDDAVTADLCTEIARGTDKWLWFVESHGTARS